VLEAVVPGPRGSYLFLVPLRRLVLSLAVPSVCSMLLILVVIAVVGRTAAGRFANVPFKTIIERSGIVGFGGLRTRRRRSLSQCSGFSGAG